MAKEGPIWQRLTGPVIGVVFTVLWATRYLRRGDAFDLVIALVLAAVTVGVSVNLVISAKKRAP